MGRRTILNKQLQEAICEIIESGHSIKTACDVVGINQSSFETWRNKGKAAIDKYGDDPANFPDTPEGEDQIKYARFYRRSTRARQRLKLDALEQIKAAGKKGDWKAAAWLLERCYDDYNRSSKVDVTSKGDKIGPDADKIAALLGEDTAPAKDSDADE